jgi:hypothetical protein
MTEIVEEKRLRDHYKAEMEHGSLVMKPFCACGNELDEDYFCDKCSKRCHCNEILCDSEATLEVVQDYIRRTAQFGGFRARLADTE